MRRSENINYHYFKSIVDFYIDEHNHQAETFNETLSTRNIKNIDPYDRKSFNSWISACSFASSCLRSSFSCRGVSLLAAKTIGAIKVTKRTI